VPAADSPKSYEALGEAGCPDAPWITIGAGYAADGLGWIDALFSVDTAWTKPLKMACLTSSIVLALEELSFLEPGGKFG